MTITLTFLLLFAVLYTINHIFHFLLYTFCSIFLTHLISSQVLLSRRLLHRGLLIYMRTTLVVRARIQTHIMLIAELVIELIIIGWWYVIRYVKWLLKLE